MRRYSQRSDGTIRTVDDSPDMLLMEAMIAGDPSRMIENHEKQGQQHVVATSMLPIDGTTGQAREAFQAMGVVFHEPVDELFVRVTLPTGWRIAATDHSLWSYLLDERGRKVTSVGYKAAFYDRWALVHPPKSESERVPPGPEDRPVGDPANQETRTEPQ